MRLSVMAGVAGLAALAALGSCSRENVHTANLLIDGVDGGVLNGFDCVADKENEIEKCVGSTCSKECPADRGFRDCIQECIDDGGAKKACSPSANGQTLLAGAGGQPACVVLDYLRVGGEIECRSMVGLLDWCLAPEHAMCPVIDRHTFPVRLPAMPVDAGASEEEHALDALYGAIRDTVTSQPVLPSPSPDEWVIARLFASTQDCATLSKSPDQIDVTRVFGCATSCTVLLKDRTDIPLVLDNGVVTCGPTAVEACAAMGTSLLPSVRAAIQRP